MANVPLFLFLLVVNVPVFLVLGRLIFGSLGGFLECLKHWFTPDLISAVQGQYWEDHWGTLKLLVFVALSGVTLYTEYSWLLPMTHA
ncbi:MAG: hypothetical protein AB7S38_10370 [Vulcanimicrobiota bacterium]